MRMPLRYLHIRKRITITVMAVLSSASASSAAAQSAPPASAKTKIIIDTDIGDDLDDAFALGLALNSPEVEILGITTAWGDTKLRARLVDRLLTETDHTVIPVAEGIRTETKSPFTQARWAEAGPPAKSHPAGVDF